ncbi:MAG TPA: hypothetical protein VK203_27525 [Nostocaceae cyanobacterium]|nr:hypothetical protein [Nostocaceae cyanobacterium]
MKSVYSHDVAPGEYPELDDFHQRFGGEMLPKLNDGNKTFLAFQLFEGEQNIIPEPANRAKTEELIKICRDLERTVPREIRLALSSALFVQVLTGFHAPVTIPPKTVYSTTGVNPGDISLLDQLVEAYGANLERMSEDTQVCVYYYLANDLVDLYFERIKCLGKEQQKELLAKTRSLESVVIEDLLNLSKPIKLALLQTLISNLRLLELAPEKESVSAL